jgi:uncharacterized repeat protein (TIGR03847 family)
MARVEHVFDPPERFVVGTVGSPGQRTFFLQAREGRRLVSVALEKQQVALLAERLNDLLDGLRAEGRDVGESTAEVHDLGALEQPIEEEFRAGALSLGWNPAEAKIVIEAHSTEDSDDEGQSAAELLKVVLSSGIAREFAARALLVVAQGRPDCPFCGEAIDADGHLCVRANGFKRRP